jgi:hypothetical protein
VGDFWRLPRLGPFRGISVHKNRALTRRDLGITSLSPLSARSIHLTCFAVVSRGLPPVRRAADRLGGSALFRAGSRGARSGD